MTRWLRTVPSVVAGVCVAASVCAAPFGARPSKPDLEEAERARLVGVWKGFTVEGKGENPDRGPVKLEITVTQRTMHGIQIQGDRRIDHGEGQYILDLAAVARRLDGVQVNERGRKRQYIGIYKLEGDTLTWCVSPRKVRPETFETKKGQFLLILRRAKKAPQAPAANSPRPAQEPTVKNSEYLEFNYGQDTGGDEWVQSIVVTKPTYRSTVRGRVTVEFRAPGLTVAKAMCWQQPMKERPGRWGHDVNLTPGGIALGEGAQGSFAFAADEFPHGPMTVRILAHDGKGKRDICELQLYNAGGVKWNEGIPAKAPAAAKGMKLVFADDFDGPLSIANDGRGARYNAHKPRFGDFSGWPFNNVNSKQPPFEQIDTYLRIKARKAPGTRGSTGFLATVGMDGKGFWAKPPCYLECRLIAQSAPGTWPAFWTYTALDRGVPGDELDIAELYGGVGKGNPNHPGYSIVSHFWRQTNPDGSKKKGFDTRPTIMKLGGKSYWSTTFHTYAARIDRKETVYYFDGIEVLRHRTNDLSLRPHVVAVNYAIGGISGWPIDLERYGNGSDMYVDYIRVYASGAK